MGSTTSNKFKLTGLKENSVYWVSVARTESGGEIGALSLPQKIITEPKSDGIYEVLVSEMGGSSINNFRVVATTTEENYNKKEKYYKTTIKGLEKQEQLDKPITLDLQVYYQIQLIMLMLV